MLPLDANELSDEDEGGDDLANAGDAPITNAPRMVGEDMEDTVWQWGGIMLNQRRRESSSYNNNNNNQKS